MAMAPSSDASGSNPSPFSPRREMTFRAMAAGMIVAAIVGGAYPYVIMKLGIGPNISVISSFLGYLLLGIAFPDFNRWENNIVQTAGTSAGQTAFLCVLMAAFDILRGDPSLGFNFSLTASQTFLWLTTAGWLGVLLAAPLRRHYIIDEKLTFAGGLVAGETLIILDSRGPEARKAARIMGLGTLVSAGLMSLREDARILGAAWYRVPEMLALGANGGSMAFGISWSLLSFGSGMLVGLRVAFSMMLGAVIAWHFGPPFLLKHHWVQGLSRKAVLLWVMWPATGMLVSGGIASVLLRWRILARSFRNFSSEAIESGEFPRSWVLLGSAASGAALIAVQKWIFGTPVWITLVAIGLSIPLMLVGLRVLGETNYGPISAMANMMQAVFGVIAPGHIMANMVASGVTGSIATESEALIQNFKAGEMIGSTPRCLTYSQLMAVPIGALAVSYVYPLLRATYGIGGENGLQSPISQKWAGFAQLLSKGLGSLPPGALAALAVAAVLGIAFAALESTRYKWLVPSPTGLGIGMLVSSSAVLTMFLGAAADYLWHRLRPESRARHQMPLATGFIAGEALVAVLLPILAGLGLLRLHR